MIQYLLTDEGGWLAFAVALVIVVLPVAVVIGAALLDRKHRIRP